MVYNFYRSEINQSIINYLLIDFISVKNYMQHGILHFYKLSHMLVFFHFNRYQQEIRNYNN